VTATVVTAEPDQRRYRHEAMFYAGPEEFLAATVPFARDGIAAGEPQLVVTGAPRVGGCGGSVNPSTLSAPPSGRGLWIAHQLCELACTAV